MMVPMKVQWTFHELPECDSTFLEARRLPAWSAVNAITQHRGRGRFNRTWFGEPGGLWICYNVPLDVESERNWGLLPLVAGAAMIRTLAPYSIPGLRLRWPNDVMVVRGKLAGILVERPALRMASIGIGVNIANDVAGLAGRTRDVAVRLSDLVPHCPSVHDFRAELAEHLAEVFTAFCERGLAAVTPLLDAAWDRSVVSEVETDTARYRGLFAGIAEDGSPLLRQPDGSILSIPGITVNRLTEPQA